MPDCLAIYMCKLIYLSPYSCHDMKACSARELRTWNWVQVHGSDSRRHVSNTVPLCPSTVSVSVKFLRELGIGRVRIRERTRSSGRQRMWIGSGHSSSGDGQGAEGPCFWVLESARMMAGICCQGCYAECHVREQRGDPKCLHLGLIEYHLSKPQIDALFHTNEESMSVRFLKKIKWKEWQL